MQEVSGSIPLGSTKLHLIQYIIVLPLIQHRSTVYRGSCWFDGCGPAVDKEPILTILHDWWKAEGRCSRETAARFLGSEPKYFEGMALR